jgi:hypothetical protein
MVQHSRLWLPPRGVLKRPRGSGAASARVEGVAALVLLPPDHRPMSPPNPFIIWLDAADEG